MRASWIVFVSTVLPAWAATTGQFNVLSFNVAGLPEILNGNDVPGDKTTNSEAIGARFAQYGHDVIHLQEVCIIAAALLNTNYSLAKGLQLPRASL